VVLPRQLVRQNLTIMRSFGDHDILMQQFKSLRFKEFKGRSLPKIRRPTRWTRTATDSRWFIDPYAKRPGFNAIYSKRAALLVFEVSAPPQCSRALNGGRINESRAS
jgi:hypothetical protein